jgi:hypothetical protein
VLKNFWSAATLRLCVVAVKVLAAVCVQTVDVVLAVFAARYGGLVMLSALVGMV